MKKILAAALMLSLALTALSAEDSFVSKMSVGGSLGVGLIMEDTSDLEDMDMDVSKIGFPIMVEALYRLDQEVEVPNLGKATIDVGMKLGYMKLWSASGTFLGTDFEFNMSTVPVLAYGRATAGDFFVGLGLGLHAWNMNVKVDGSTNDLYGDNGLDFCLLIEPGYVYPLSEDLSLLGSLSIWSVGYEGDGGDTSSTVIGANVGVSYKL